MVKQVFIPKLGQTMEEATLVRWLVPDGAVVVEGQGILEVETDKAVFTVEANARGHLHLGPYQAGDVVPVLTVVAVIGKPEDAFAPGEQLTAELPAPSETETSGALPVPPVLSKPQPATPGDKILVSPRARKLANAKGVNLVQVTPTGNGGARVVERDVLAFIAQLPKMTPVAQRMAAQSGVDLRTITGTGPRRKVTKQDVVSAGKSTATLQPEPGSYAEAIQVMERVPLAGVRGITTERMATSAHTTARVTLLAEVDATELVALRERLKRQLEGEWGFVPGYNDLIAKIVAQALQQYPYMNARLATGGIERLASINLGMATDTERGLLVPVIRDADKKSLRQLGLELRELIERARRAKLSPDDLSGGTFTITNLGMYDIMAFTPIINLPETAILGVGCITPKPAVRNNQVVIRQILVLSLAFDHRVVDGAPAARFLKYIKDLVEEPFLGWAT